MLTYRAVVALLRHLAGDEVVADFPDIELGIDDALGDIALMEMADQEAYGRQSPEQRRATALARMLDL